MYHSVAAQSSFMTVQVADTHAHIQRVVSVVKMATVLEECAAEEQRPLLRLLWAKELNAKDIRKEIFPVYGSKCLSRKDVQNWIKKFSQGRSKVADDVQPGAEVAETAVKRLLCCGFRHRGKGMGQEFRCWWRICREINVFSRSEYYMFYIYIHL
jgi:hypothetical protein